jgi:hypothetical protein
MAGMLMAFQLLSAMADYSYRGRHEFDRSWRGLPYRRYRGMKERVAGTRKNPRHFGAIGKPLVDRETFVEWSLNDPEYNRLYAEWVATNYDRKLSPSIDRIDNNGGYTIDNMQWLTSSQNQAKELYERR